MEYIEREKFKAEIKRLSTHYLNEWDTLGVLAAVDRIPAADVRPVVRAHWTDHRTIEHDGEWYCSNCGNEVTICMCGKDKTWDYPFCPNCGAKMEES